MNLENAIKENTGAIVDVRSNEEFMEGNVPGSINIPLQELTLRLPEIKKLQEPLILCCASGGRSGVAFQILSQQGIKCLNAGSWMDVNYYHNKKNK